MPVRQTARIKQIRRECHVAAFDRVAIDVVIGKQALFIRLAGAVCQSDNHHMHMGFAARVRAPGKSAVGEGDFQPAAVKQDWPELRDLFSLRDRVCRDEADVALSHIPPP